MQNSTPSYSDSEFKQAINTNFEQSSSILQLLELKNQNKQISDVQRETIVNNKNYTTENKLMLLTCLNDKSPETTLKNNFEKQSKEAIEKTTALKTQKENNLKNNAKKLANGVEKVSRFSVD